MRNLLTLTLGLILFISTSSIYAEETKPEEILKDWSAFKCYTVSGAIEMLAFKNGEKLSKVSRDKGRFYIRMSEKNSDNFEVTYFAGFPLKTASQAILKIDGSQKFLLYSHPEPQNTLEKAYAWSHPNDDKKLISALKKGSEAIIESNSHTGKVIKDTFALTGFTAAFNFMKTRCK
tara:strand:- start:28 stop:555 length:528 start_codon:yes stop_codon:yes gene_type:complete